MGDDRALKGRKNNSHAHTSALGKVKRLSSPGGTTEFSHRLVRAAWSCCNRFRYWERQEVGGRGFSRAGSCKITCGLKAVQGSGRVGGPHLRRSITRVVDTVGGRNATGCPTRLARATRPVRLPLTFQNRLSFARGRSPVVPRQRSPHTAKTARCVENPVKCTFNSASELQPLRLRSDGLFHGSASQYIRAAV